MFRLPGSGSLALVGLLSPLALSALPRPALAHTTVVAEDVAGTWHIEPNHNPKAGETATAWVALTRVGGTLLPLSEAQCQLQVYTQPRSADDTPILQPPVKAIAAEQYEGIPGADLVFPNPGLYDLELSCTPVQEESFVPFTLAYEVAVAAGTNPAGVTPTDPTDAADAAESVTSPSTPVASTPEAATAEPGSLGWAIALLSLVGVGGWLWIAQSSKR